MSKEKQVVESQGEKTTKKPVEKKATTIEKYEGTQTYTIVKEIRGGHKKGTKVELAYERALNWQSKGLI